MKKKLMFAISSIMLIVTLITTILVAFLLDGIIEKTDLTVGEIKVGYDIFFTKDEDKEQASEVLIDSTIGLKKSGVYFVNLDSTSSMEYITNLNVDILVDSTVDTYIRVKVYEQLTLTVTNYLNQKTEISIISPRTEFNLFQDDTMYWEYDDETGYYYCTKPVKAIGANDDYETNIIKFIIPLESNYSPRPLNYSLQIGIEIDAVQAAGGPQNNWKMTIPPWEGNWE